MEGERFIHRFFVNKLLDVTWDTEMKQVQVLIDGEPVLHCAFLVASLPTNDETITSIDDLASQPGAKKIAGEATREILTIEEEVAAHASNIQAWVEHDYDTRLLHSNISFTLLKILAKKGDVKAKKVLDADLSDRIKNGTVTTIQAILDACGELLDTGVAETAINGLPVEFRHEAWNTLGNALSRTTNYDDRIRAYRNAITIKPDFPDALNNLSCTYARKKMWKEAIDMARRAIHIDPKIGLHYTTLGEALEGTGDLEGAILTYQYAIAFDPYEKYAISYLKHLGASFRFPQGVIRFTNQPFPESPPGVSTKIFTQICEIIKTFFEKHELAPNIADTIHKTKKSNAIIISNWKIDQTIRSLIAYGTLAFASEIIPTPILHYCFNCMHGSREYCDSRDIGSCDDFNKWKQEPPEKEQYLKFHPNIDIDISTVNKKGEVSDVILNQILSIIISYLDNSTDEDSDEDKEEEDEENGESLKTTTILDSDTIDNFFQAITGELTISDYQVDRAIDTLIENGTLVKTDEDNFRWSGLPLDSLVHSKPSSAPGVSFVQFKIISEYLLGAFQISSNVVLDSFSVIAAARRYFKKYRYLAITGKQINSVFQYLTQTGEIIEIDNAITTKTLQNTFKEKIPKRISYWINQGLTNPEAEALADLEAIIVTEIDIGKQIDDEHGRFDHEGLGEHARPERHCHCMIENGHVVALWIVGDWLLYSNPEPDYTKSWVDAYNIWLPTDIRYHMPISELPSSFENFIHLRELDLGNNRITKIPISFGNLTKLEHLVLCQNAIGNLPDSFGNLVNMHTLHIQHNYLDALPQSFVNLRNLCRLDLRNNCFTKLPENFANLTSLEYLYLDNNHIAALPESFGNLVHLRELYLHRNPILSLPKTFGELVSLEKFLIEFTHLEALPASFEKLQSLRETNLNKKFNDIISPLLLKNASKELIKHLEGIHSNIFSFSPDDTILAISDYSTVLWDIKTWKQIHVLKGTKMNDRLLNIKSTTFSPDGLQLFTTEVKNINPLVRVWDLQGGTELQVLNNKDWLFPLQLTMDKRILAVRLTQGCVGWYEVSTCKEMHVFKEQTRNITALAFSADGNLFASAEDYKLKIRDGRSGKELHVLNANNVEQLEFSKDNLLLIICSKISRDKQSTQVWDTNAWKLLQALDDYGNPMISPDGTVLATLSEDNKAQLWDVQVWEDIMDGRMENVSCYAFSPDGSMFATGSNDKAIILWHIRTRAIMRVLNGHTGKIWSLLFSNNGKMLLSRSNDGVRVWSIPEPPKHDETIVSRVFRSNAKRDGLLRVFRGHEGCICSIAFSSDGTMIATGSEDYTARLWNVATGEEMHVLRGHMKFVKSVAFSPDGTILATGSSDCTVRYWNVATGQELRVLREFDSWVLSVAFSPDGALLAIAPSNEATLLWNVATGEELSRLRGHTGILYAVAFSPNGTLLATCSGGFDDNTARLWDIATGNEQLKLKKHNRPVKAVAFSPDGKVLATGSEDNTVRIWDVTTGKELYVLTKHSDTISSVAFSSDGTLLASGSWDKTVRLWDVATWREQRLIRGLEGVVHSVAFSPDGTMLAVGFAYNNVRLWKVKPLEFKK